MPPASSASSRSIAESFASLRKSGFAIGLIPFIAAGYPDLAATRAVVRAVDVDGVAAIEIGFPFSDPIADGPTIQQAYTAALARKLRTSEIFQTIRELKDQITAPMVGMVSISMVYRYGPARFFADARAAGFSGMLIPDLPPPEAQATCELVRAAGLDTVLLVAPTTSPERRAEIARLCSGFVYYLSVSGITGARADLPSDLTENVRQLKSMTDRPVCVGFGISKPEHMRALGGIADGAIVGSAIVRLMTESSPRGPQAVAETVGQYCRQLISAVSAR